jgi:hypothetical protein
VIGRVLPRGANVRGVLHYLFGKGKQGQHVNPHLVAGWLHPAELEPPRRADGSRNFNRLTGQLELPVQLARGKVADEFVYHLVLRCAPEDPDLGDGAWNAIATEVMHRTGLSERGREDAGVRWVAVHHGENHVHIVATLAGQDRKPVWPRNDFYRIGEALRDIEREYGLRVLTRADRTAPRALTRAEMEQSAHSGAEPDRVVLYRHVRGAAAAARSEEEFLAALADSGVLVRLRHSAVRPDEVTGYAVALDHGPDRRPVWFSGGKLAADLTLPKLRRRWAGPRLTGRGMGDPPARTVLAREALRAARAARSEPEFFALLERAGLPARLRAAPDQAGRPARWSVTLPGLTDRAGQPAWFAGGTLDPALRLGELRARWRAGQPGAGPGPGLFTGTARAQIYQHAAQAATRAARELEGGRAGRADVAWAAADLLTAAAEATGNPELARSAEAFTRAARTAWGRTPAPSPAGSMLRTAAYLLASCRRTRQPQPARALRVLLTVLADLARTLAELRAAQARRLQAAAAAAAAAGLADVAARIDYGESIAHLAATSFPLPPQAARPAPAAGSAPRRRAGPVTSPITPRRPRRGI